VGGVCEFVFPNSSDYSKHLKEVKKSFKTACRLSEITGLTFHDLRHTCATRLVEANVLLHAVTKLLGHSSVKVTERYSHPEESVYKATEVLADLEKKCDHRNLEV
jgi:integrase